MVPKYPSPHRHKVALPSTRTTEAVCVLTTGGELGFPTTHKRPRPHVQRA